MTGFNILNLSDLIDVIGESETESFLQNYECDINSDIEFFLRNRAIEFAKQGIAATHLVITSHKGEPVLVGYYTLANKVLVIPEKYLSKTLAKRISKFAVRNQELKHYALSCPLIAQLGKNFNNGYNKLITGDELLKLACEEIKQFQIAVGGKFTYIECEDISYLTEFYGSNGFIRIKDRYLEKSEKRKDDPDYLVQMIKHL